MSKKQSVGVGRKSEGTPGGPPIFSFSVGSRKNFPSKWDDAEKWVISGPAVHGGFVKSQDFVSNGNGFVVKPKQHDEVPRNVCVVCMDDDEDRHQPQHVLLKDKFTNKCTVPIKEGFVFSTSSSSSPLIMKEATTCMSPPSMSGPLSISSCSFELQECKLQPGIWSSMEEEEEQVSKSLRHFEEEMNNIESPKTIPSASAFAWEQEQIARSHLRYQREEAKIQAWVNLQNAKAQAQSRKLEVKIQKMRSKFEEKMMKKMASVDRKAEELRAAAQYDHKRQPLKSTMQSLEVHESLHFSGTCCCFPCSPLNL